MADNHQSSLRSRKQRAKNEVLFRKANEQIQSTARRLYEKEEKDLFLCECSSDECFEHLPVALKDYEKLTEGEARFIVLTDHDQSDLERIVSQHDGYVVVEKFPELV